MTHLIRVFGAAMLAMLAAVLPAASQPVFSQVFSPDTIGPGSTTTLTFTIDNSGSVLGVTDLAFSNMLPAGVTIAPAPLAASSCAGGTLSAPASGGTISYSGGAVGPGSSCTVAVNVTSSTVGTAMNTSGDLTSSAGNSGSSTDDLMVVATLPGFIMGFAPGTVGLNGISRLTYTIDNSGSAVNIANIDFSHALTAGLSIAPSPNLVSTCVGPLGTAITAPAGGSTITVNLDGFDLPGFHVLSAGATCTIGVDIRGTAVGTIPTATDNLQIDFVSVGKASASLTVTGATPGAPALSKAFTSGPALPGSVATLEFTILNSSPSDAATAIGFTDDLDAMLTGAVLTGAPPANPCGAGSAISGTGTLSFTGGTLAARSSCTFSVNVLVPGGATAGTYPNTTSPLAATVSGSGVISEAASADLIVTDAAPPVLVKAFLNDPVVPGGTVQLELTISNPNATSAASAIAFDDNIGAMFSGITATVASDSCGGTTSFFIDSLAGEMLTHSGISLAAGLSCTVTWDLDIPTGVPGGSYGNTTTPISATVGGATVYGAAASDSLVIDSDLSMTMTKTFAAAQVLPSSPVDVTFQMTNSSDGVDATEVAFTDDLDAFHSGAVLAAVGANSCGGAVAGTGTGTIAFSGGAVPADTDCALTVTITMGPATGNPTNTTSVLTAKANGATAAAIPGSAGSDSIEVTGTLPVILSKTFTDDPVLPGGTVTLEFTIDNPNAGFDADDIFFFDNVAANLAGLAATGALTDPCGTGSSLSGTTTLIFTGGSLLAGTSCTFSVTLDVPAGAGDGSYNNTTSTVSATVNGVGTNGLAATDLLVVDTDFLQLDKVFTDDPVFPGDNARLRFTITNQNAAVAVTALAFTDDLNAMLAGANGTLVSNTCGGTFLSPAATLELTGGSVAADASCTIEVDVAVPGGALPGSYPNTTSALSGTAGGAAVSGFEASDSLQVISAGSPTFAKEFLTDPVAAGGTTVLRFTITNPAAGSALSDLAFTDNLNVVPGMVATGLPASNVCGDGSQIAGTGFLTFTGGSLVPDSSCTIDVTLQVPTGVSGTYDNTTSNLFSSGLPVAGPASDSLTVVGPPGFAKVFAPGSVVQGEISTLTFTIDNSAAAIAATAVDFTDNLPAGVTLATPANAATTCTGGTLTAAGGGTSVGYTGGTVAANDSCTIDVDVTSVTVGAYVNTSGDLTSSLGNSGTATDTLTVTAAAVPGFAKLFAPDAILQGEVSTLTFTLDNSAAAVAATAVDFTDNLPAGVTLATPANAATTCTGGTLSAPDGGAAVSYTGGTVPAAASCTIDVDVTSVAVGAYVNTSGDLTSSLGNSGTATDTLNVGPAPVPGFAKAFAPDTIQQNGISTLSFTIDNTGASISAASLAFTDNLPPAIRVAATPNPSSTCIGGTLTTVPGGSVVSYTSGSVDPGDSCVLSVDVSSTAVGAHVNISGALTSSLGNSGTATATLTVDVQPNGQVTIVQTTNLDATFGFASSEPTLTFSITTVGGTGQQGPVSVPNGTYTITQSRPTGFNLTSITCTDGNSTGDPATGILTLQVDPAEFVTCTFVSADSGSVASAIINQFLTNRIDLMLSNEPDRERRIDRLNRGTETEVLRFTQGDILSMVPFKFDLRSVGSDNFAFSSSLADVTRAVAAVELAHSPAGATRNLPGNPFDVWLEAAYSRFDGGPSSAGRFAIVYLGADYLVTPDLLIGALVQVDDMTETAALTGSTTEGTGWMVGPYLTARVAPNLYFDARFAWGKSDNTISPVGTYVDAFGTTRWLTNASLSGEFERGNWKFRPNLSLSYMEETQAAYVDSLNAAVPSQTVGRGQLRFGPNASTKIAGRNGKVIEPHFTLDGIYSLDNGADPTASAVPDGWRARFETGVNIYYREGARLSFTANYDGIGQSGFESYGASLSLEIPF